MKSLMIAFSMYSKIPMPGFVWEDKDRAMCFFPAVGAAVGVCFFLVWYVFDWIYGGSMAGRLMSGAALTAVPILVTGGIHMDGFLDVCDARASYGDREKKLEILKDTHVGAFAVIRGCLYFLAWFAACAGLEASSAAAISLGFMLSRSLSAWLVASVPGARKKGMLADFTDGMEKKAIRIACIGTFAVSGIGMGYLAGPSGAAAVLLALMTAFFCRKMMIKEFGGITGDLAGYFLQCCELVVLLTLSIGGTL